MGSLYFYVKDLDGKPIQNAEVTATMSQQPCGLLAIGCSSGPDYTESGYTDANGEWIGDIKYSKAPTVKYSVSATGYYDQVGSQAFNGANIIDWNVWGTINVSMTPKPTNSPGSPPPGQGTGVIALQQLETDITSGSYELQQGGMIAAVEIPIVIAVVAIMVIVIVVIYARFSV